MTLLPQKDPNQHIKTSRSKSLDDVYIQYTYSDLARILNCACSINNHRVECQTNIFLDQLHDSSAVDPDPVYFSHLDPGEWSEILTKDHKQNPT